MNTRKCQIYRQNLSLGTSTSQRKVKSPMARGRRFETARLAANLDQRKFASLLAVITLASCSPFDSATMYQSSPSGASDQTAGASGVSRDSGTVVISHQIKAPKPEAEPNNLPAPDETGRRVPLAALSGFTPGVDPFLRKASPAQKGISALFSLKNTSDFVPAVNETWLRLNSTTGILTVLHGAVELRRVELKQEALKQIAVSPVELAGVSRESIHTAKSIEQNPRWYAPDSYFTERRLAVPAANDPIRFRRGALGQYAIEFDSGLVIHSGAIESKEVLGLRVDAETMSLLERSLQPGTVLRITAAP